MYARLSALLMVGGLCSGTQASAAVDERCGSLQACVGAVRKLAAVPGPYAQATTPAETALLARLRSFDGAVPQLVALLADSDDAVANIAAVGLRDADTIDPIFLPQVRAGLDRRLGWLAPALGRMPSDAAAREAVARLLRGLEAIAPQYPGVCFAVPRESEIVEDRPAAWAFVPDGLLTDETRMRLGSLLLEL